MPHRPTPAIYRSYAKINLYLDVLNPRPDGYNNIETIFQTVGLYDELHVAPSSGDIRFTCSNPALCCGDANLVCRAARTLREASGATAGAHLHLIKRIPIAAGLAGGSGDAAAALLALNDLWDLHWPMNRLQALAIDLGSDVPYCLAGGTAAATQRGEAISPLPPMPDAAILLAHPPMAVSTAHVYKHPRLARSPETPRAHGRTPAFQAAIEALERGDIAAAVFNRMESAVFFEHPALAALKQRLLTLGCCAAAMSGSGPTIFGICASLSEARRIAGALPEYPVSIVQSVPWGVQRMP